MYSCCFRHPRERVIGKGDRAEHSSGSASRTRLSTRGGGEGRRGGHWISLPKVRRVDGLGSDFLHEDRVLNNRAGD